MNATAKKIITTKLTALQRSTFRSSFHLHSKERSYLERVGLSKIKDHAYDIINKNLAPAEIPNDGKQTPMKNHPVFIAEHATATCCRTCLYKWHHIAKGRPLTENEINYIVTLIIEWIKRDYQK